MPIKPNHTINDGQLQKLIILTCLCWLAIKLISWKLWLAYRLFPLVPPFSFLQLPAWGHLLLFVISLICLCWLVARPMHVKVWRVLLLAEIASCLFDQNRWQPWEFQFVSFFALTLLAYKKPRLIAGGLAFILFSTYFFSGIAKVNSGFIKVVWQWLVLTRFLHLPAAVVNNHLVSIAGYVIPLIETGAAIFLLFDKSRKAAAIILIATHCFNFLLLGPFGLSVNSVIWPWNMLMIALLYLLFFRHNTTVLQPAVLLKRNLFWLVILWGILPLTNRLGGWDDFLSSAIYSGKSKDLVFCVDTASNKPSQKLLVYASKNDQHNLCPGAKVVSATLWSLQEIKVPCYPETRVYTSIIKQLTGLYPKSVFGFRIYRSGEIPVQTH